MTDKELRKLSKTEILQLLVDFSQEVDSLHETIDHLSRELEEKNRQLNLAEETAKQSVKIAENIEIFKEAAALYVREHKHALCECREREENGYEEIQTALS